MFVTMTKFSAATRQEVSEKIARLCKENTYPPSVSMMMDRLKADFPEFIANPGSRSYVHKRMQLFAGSGFMLVQAIQCACDEYFPPDLMNVIMEFRGQDTIVIRHRNFPRIVRHLKTLCQEAGFGCELEKINNSDESKQNGSEEDRLFQRMDQLAANELISTERLVQVEVSMKCNLRKEPPHRLYIAILGQSKTIVEDAWKTIRGDVIINATEVQDKLKTIDSEVNAIYNDIEENHILDITWQAKRFVEPLGELMNLAETFEKDAFLKRAFPDTSKERSGSGSPFVESVKSLGTSITGFFKRSKSGDTPAPPTGEPAPVEEKSEPPPAEEKANPEDEAKEEASDSEEAQKQRDQRILDYLNQLDKNETLPRTSKLRAPIPLQLDLARLPELRKARPFRWTMSNEERLLEKSPLVGYTNLMRLAVSEERLNLLPPERQPTTDGCVNLKLAWRHMDEETADQCITVQMPSTEMPRGRGMNEASRIILGFEKFRTERWKEVLMYCRRRIAWRIWDDKRRVQLRQTKQKRGKSIREMRREMKKEQKLKKEDAK